MSRLRTTPRRLILIALLTTCTMGTLVPSVLPFLASDGGFGEGPLTCFALKDAWQRDRDAPPASWAWDDDEVHEEVFFGYIDWREAGGAWARGAHFRLAFTLTGLIVLAYAVWIATQFEVQVRVVRRRRGEC